ncbi:MAG: hypothetical protein DHS20C14_11600 [Phycisphaeraceae bacterium]|nr:MAG: hypothetical protein DHS20C14_11600 [Phycisphaeraceae bacterium]
MKTSMKAALFGGALLCAGVAEAKHTYRIDGPSTTATGDSYFGWDGTGLTEFRAALNYSYFFSHFFATVDTSIQTYDFDYLGCCGTLARADCIISPWWSDSNTANYEAFIASYHFRNGGDLLLFNDDSGHDYIGDYLGLPTQDYASSYTFNDSTFPFDGPFGTTTSVNMAGNIGFLNDVDVANAGGTVLARNGSGQIVVAFWDDGDYSPGSGRMIIVTDVNTVISAEADYSSFNDNARFGLNLVAGLIGPDGCNNADCDKNGVLNVDDVECFVDTFLGGCN